MPTDRHRWSPNCDPPRSLVRPVAVDARGSSGPTPNEARGPRWRRTSAGLFVPAVVSVEVPEQRLLEASTAWPLAAVTGWGGLRLASAGFFDGLDSDGVGHRPVDLVVGPRQSRRQRTGIRWHQDRFEESEVWVRHGIRFLTPLRSAFDEMRWAASLRQAVEAMDMTAAADLTSIARMRAYAEGRAGWAGVEQVRRALELADECSRSPAESRFRLAWVLDARCPRPLANRDVFDPGGRLLGIADLIDPVAGVVGEYDGADHAGSRRRSRDAERDSAFRDHGLEVFRVTGWDAHRPEALVERVRAAYRRAGESKRPRRWTLQPPPGWETAPTLDDMLDHRDLLRELHSTG